MKLVMLKVFQFKPSQCITLSILGMSFEYYICFPIFQLALANRFDVIFFVFALICFIVLIIFSKKLNAYKQEKLHASKFIGNFWKLK